MGDLAKELLSVNIEEEMKQSYLDYAMSVIVGRALPDVRDGLKPVHRRVLFAMQVLNNDWNKPYKKSARVVGDVIGKYHPHGDSAVYDTIVRMAQDFAMRHMLVDGQGNFGSIDGDSAAAMRYTEIRMAKFAHELLADLDKDTVDYVDNYDGTERIPEVLPTRVPNLLVNGSSGIAVGMATNIPPHNLREAIDACLALIVDPDTDVDGLMEYMKGPDFPTGGFIYGRKGIVDAFRTGRGRVYVRARTHIEMHDKTGRETLVVTEVPYQVNKARLIEKIAELVKDKKIEGISALRDESDKDGLRIAIEIKRGDMSEVVLNNLYAQTQLESVFGINTVALVDGQPQTLNLKQMLEAFIRHRREVVTRRTIYELRKARERGHILEGLAVALNNIDPVIELIKASPSGKEAKERLLARSWNLGDVSEMLERAGSDACRPDGLDPAMGVHEGQYYLSPDQAQAILDLRLQKLTGMEHEKLLDEYRQIIENIGELLRILNSEARLMEVIEGELVAVRDEFSEPRRTEIVDNREDFSVEDLINEEDMVVTISHTGYAKTQPLSSYDAQRRGGRGKSALGIKDEDFVDMLLVASTHDTLLCFTDSGRVFWLKVYQIPQAGRQSRGRPLVNLLQLNGEERVTTVLPVREYTPDHFVFMATANGTVKKTSLEAFAKRRSNGLIALSLDEGDHLVQASITDGTRDIMLFSECGKAVRFPESSVREMGRTARGVRGIRLAGGDRLISLMLPNEDATVLTVSEKGYGKRTLTSDFPTKSRATLGVIAMVVNDRNGPLVSAIQLTEGDQVMLISDQGTLVRTRSEEISVLSRNTQGVRIIRLSEGEKLVGVDRIEEPEEVDDLEETGAVETLDSDSDIDSSNDIDDINDDVADDSDD